MKNSKQKIVLICSLFLAACAVTNRLHFFEEEEEKGEAGAKVVKLSEIHLNQNDITQYFAVKEITEVVSRRISNRSYRANDNISLEEMRYLTVLHYNFDHEIQVGELIVNVDIAEEMCQIFRELFQVEYEIQSLKLIDDYWVGDGNSSDAASVQANNSSAFCYRTIAGTDKLSNHAMGYAIDINPLQNPMVVYTNGIPSNYPAYSQAYVERRPEISHVITEEDPCYQIFKKYGYTWGGDWGSPKDYQHFEKKRH